MAPVGSVPAANPSTYIESGAVASDISGASDAPTIEPVAKITAEFAPVSACAAESLTTLERARASPEVSSAAVTSNRLALCIGDLWRPQALKHQRQVVGWHIGDFEKGETGATRQLFQRLNIAYAPFGIAFSQACVKHLVADGRMLAAALEWAVQEQPPILLQIAPGACEQAFGNAPWRYMDHVGAEHCQ